MRAVSREEMIALDRDTISHHGIKSWELMQAAGYAVAQQVLSLPQSQRIGVICGCGNNGGDGMVAARELLKRGLSVCVFLLGKKTSLKNDALLALESWEKARGETREIVSVKGLQSGLCDCDVWIDAIFGTGLTKRENTNSSDLLFQAIALIRQSKGMGQVVLAIDLPSGMDANTGLALNGEMVAADITVTMGLPKIGMLSSPGYQVCGKLIVAPLSFPKNLLEIANSAHQWIEAGDVQIQKRLLDSNKGHYGHVLLIGGSARMPGAIALAVKAALRGGAGKVTAIVPGRDLAFALAARNPEAMWFALEPAVDGSFHDQAGNDLNAFLKEHRQDRFSLAMGPGMGTGKGAVDLFHTLGEFRKDFPMVLDADALNLWAKYHSQASLFESFGPDHAPLVLTPHPGELSRLMNTKNSEVQANRLAWVKQSVNCLQSWIVLKGYRTLFATPTSLDINTTGNPGMAKGGMGDILCGLIAARLAVCLANGQKNFMSWRKAVQTAIFLHGLAGDIAARRMGEEALLPRDLLRALPQAFQGVQTS